MKEASFLWEGWCALRSAGIYSIGTPPIVIEMSSGQQIPENLGFVQLIMISNPFSRHWYQCELRSILLSK